MKILVSGRQNAEKSRPEVEKQAPAEYITLEFYVAINNEKGGTRLFRVT